MELEKITRLFEPQVKVYIGNNYLLEVAFKDAEGGHYIWCPRWEEVRRLFWYAVQTEDFNMRIGKGNLEECEKFKRCGQTAIERLTEGGE